jgi:hypothetical protein
LLVRRLPTMETSAYSLLNVKWILRHRRLGRG